MADEKKEPLPGEKGADDNKGKFEEPAPLRWIGSVADKMSSFGEELHGLNKSSDVEKISKYGIQPMDKVMQNAARMIGQSPFILTEALLTIPYKMYESKNFRKLVFALAAAGVGATVGPQLAIALLLSSYMASDLNVAKDAFDSKENFLKFALSVTGAAAGSAALASGVGAVPVIASIMGAELAKQKHLRLPIVAGLLGGALPTALPLLASSSLSPALLAQAAAFASTNQLTSMVVGAATGTALGGVGTLGLDDTSFEKVRKDIKKRWDNTRFISP